MKSYNDLNTEAQNSETLDIHKLSTINILKKINDEDNKIATIVRKSINEIKKTTELAINSVKSGGRIFYIGSGTSGRLGVLDASEIPPTYSASKNTFIGIISGGDDALRNSIEGAEDSSENAIKDLLSYNINKKDTVIGISCSGASTYVISSLDYSKLKGASTIYLVTNPKPYILTEVDVIIKANTGPEVITGSTRMKAGTATKMIINMISTTTMIKLGKVYKNLMIDLMAVNNKLIDRGVRIIMQITGISYEKAKKKLFGAKKSVKAAIIMIKLDCDLKKANKRIKKFNGVLSNIIDE